MRECVPGASAGGEARSAGPKSASACGVRSVPASTRCNAVQRRRPECNALQQYGTSQRRYIDKLGVGPILPLLHEIDAVAELQRLDVPVLVQRHAPIDGSRALTRLSLTCKQAHACACVCLCVCLCGCVSVCVCAIRADRVTAADGDS